MLRLPSPRVAWTAMPLLLALRAADAQQGTGRITGIVRDDMGAPVPGMLIRAGDRGAQTGAEGGFTIEGVPAGTTRLWARRLGLPPRDTTITLAAGETARWNPLVPSSRTMARAIDSTRNASGTVDSAALGFVRADPTLSRAYSPFANKFVREVLRAHQPTENVVLSPVSARLALGLLATGARGATAQEMATALQTSATDPLEIARMDSTLSSRLRDRQDVELAVENAVWLDRRFTPTPEFTRVARDMYGAVVRSVPLASRAALDEINGWVRKATRERITSMRDDPFSDTVAALIANAVYFKGRWLTPFEKDATTVRAFHLANGRIAQVPMMEQTAKLGYLRGKNYQVARLPYRGGRSALYVVLPDKGVSPDAVFERFARDGWPRSLVAGDQREVHLLLPRFKTEMSFSLNEELKKIGLGRIYDCETADLSGVTGVLRTCLSEASQKVFLQLDEEGTEAAAVTVLEVVVTSMVVPPKPIEFVVDRPFLLLLRDESTGVELFVGRIANPQ